MPINDAFTGYAPSLESPFVDGFDIVPDDSQDLSNLTRGLMVTTAGDVAVVFAGGSTVTLPGLIPGQQYIGRIRRVLSTGTTASGLKGLV